MIVDPHFAVAAEAIGVDGDCLDHGLPAADGRAFLVQHRPAAAQHRDVGGGAAHVGDQDVILARQVTRADQARGRAGENRLDRAGQRQVGLDQRPVALHHHQRRLDALARQQPFDRLHQLLQLRNEARVERGGERAARRVELGGELVAAGHRLSGQLAHQGAHRDLVRRIAHREIAADREGRDLGRVLQDRRAHRRHVQLGLRLAGRLVAAGHHHHRIAAHRLAQAGALQRLGIVAHEDEADRRAVLFHDRVGGEGGGDRDHGDVGDAAVRRQMRQDRLDRAGQPDREVMLGGERLGLGDHAAIDLGARGVEQDRVGVGSARIEPKQDRQVTLRKMASPAGS